MLSVGRDAHCHVGLAVGAHMHTGGVLVITAVRGDITDQDVDAIVIAANNPVRGGGGVDGAIHRGGGPAILRDCIDKFPNGLATGDAGWTTAGDLPARWVIHTVGPSYNAGQQDRSLLESCYRRALEVADELGARSVAFPLIRTGIFGWPRHEAIAAAIETLATADTRVDEVRLVAFDPEMHEEVRAQLGSSTPIRIFQGVQLLHRRGYHRLRVLPGMSPSGMYWRVAITAADNMTDDDGFLAVRDYQSAIMYSTGGLTDFAGGEVTVATSPETVADLILNALPEAAPTADDPAYVSWFADLMQLVERAERAPIAYADYFDDDEGWEVGWGSGIRHPHPPPPPKPTNTTPKRSARMRRLTSTPITDDSPTLLHRLDAILGEATGLSPKAHKGGGLLTPRTDPYCPSVTVKFPANQVRGADRASLFADGDCVHLGIWPAELQPQYTYMYSDPARVDALLELHNHTGFTVEPNFQLAYRFAQPLQRWYPSRLLAAKKYLRQWIDDFRHGYAGGRTLDQIADPQFFRWLVERRYALDSEQESLRGWLSSKSSGLQIHIRPGIQVLRTWSCRVFASDRRAEFVAELREATDQMLSAIGQPKLNSMR
jgi:O-acetyl-ADP-ribose deacetylase